VTTNQGISKSRSCKQRTLRTTKSETLHTYKMTTESKPELVYWGIAGRGELARIIAAAGGLEITEVPAFPEGQSSIEYGSPGSLPALSHGDLKIAQSAAIESYFINIAPKFSDLTAQQKAVDMQYCLIKEDCLQGAAAFLFAKERDVDALKKHLEKWFGLLESIVPSSGFVHGLDYPTAADCAVLNVCTGYMPFIGSYKVAEFDVSKYPKVHTLSERTGSAIASFPFPSTELAIEGF